MCVTFQSVEGRPCWTQVRFGSQGQNSHRPRQANGYVAFFFSSLQQNSSSGEALYIYIYIYLSPSSIKLLISQEEQLCFKPLGQEDYSCLFFSFILFKRSNKDGYLTGVIYALFLTRMGRRWQLGP